MTDTPKFKKSIKAISIVDEYLEHARVMIFQNGGKNKFLISLADWMVRNLDHRIEVAVPITNKEIRNELKDMIDIQLSDNVKARILDNNLSNNYVSDSVSINRSQFEIYKYLCDKQQKKETLVNASAFGEDIEQVSSNTF
jgi:polyphosphate kinase